MKKNLQFFLIALFLVHSSQSWAQNCITPNKAADSVQLARGAANNLFNKDNANKEDIEEGIQILNQALRFLDSAPINRLGERNFYLKRRKADVTRDLVYAYALNHQYEQAITALNQQFNEGASAFVLEMAEDSVFNQLNSDSRFAGLMAKYKARIALWGGTAFKTPLQPDLPEADKIAGLSLLWTQARANFVYFDHVSQDWNRTYVSYIPKVQATKSTLEYYKVLQKFYAQLHDGHTNVYVPNELSREVNSRPPITTELIEGRVFITAVSSDSLQKTGVVPGLEIIKIDGHPVKGYAEAYIMPYQSSSTTQDLDIRTYSYFLLAGGASKPVALELKDRKGHSFNRYISRSGYPKRKLVPAMEYREIDHIGYLAIHNFEDNRIVKQLDSLFSEIAKTKGLIIDIRNNGGGDSGIGNQILASFTDKPFELFASRHVQYDALIGSPQINEPLWANEGSAGQSRA